EIRSQVEGGIRLAIGSVIWHVEAGGEGESGLGRASQDGRDDDTEGRSEPCVAAREASSRNSGAHDRVGRLAGTERGLLSRGRGAGGAGDGLAAPTGPVDGGDADRREAA